MNTNKKKEYEIIQHTAMNYLEIFLVEVSSRNPHGHSDLEVGTLLEGSVELILEHKRITLKKNDIFVISPYQTHSFLNAGGKNLFLTFQINTEFYKNISSRLTRIHLETIIDYTNPHYNSLFASLIACAGSYFFEEEYFELKCASLLFDILHTLTRTKGSFTLSEKEHDSARNNTLRLNRILDYVAEHYTEHITLEDIGAIENITACHASHFIKKVLGVSFQEYLNNLRFEHAYRLISRTSLSILDICLESGFSSSRYLNQMFQKRLGVSASEYRRGRGLSPLPSPALPTDNLQKRLSAEASKKVLASYT